MAPRKTASTAVEEQEPLDAPVIDETPTPEPETPGSDDAGPGVSAPTDQTPPEEPTEPAPAVPVLCDMCGNLVREAEASDAPPSTGFFLTEGGMVLQMDLPLPTSVAERVVKGAIVQVADAEGTPLTRPQPIADLNVVDRIATMAPPPKSASRAVWTGYAVRQGGMTVEAADAMTKADLVERFTK